MIRKYWDGASVMLMVSVVPGKSGTTPNGGTGLNGGGGGGAGVEYLLAEVIFLYLR